MQQSNQNWDDHVIYVFPFVNVMYHIVWFAYVELFLWPWDESDFVVTWSFLCVVGFDLLIFCWEVLYLYSSKFLACNSFLVMSLSGYGIRMTSWLWSVPSYSVFWKTLRRISIFVSLVKFPSEAFWFQSFVYREVLFVCLLITDSISLLEIGLFKLSIYSWFSFTMHMFLET